MEHKDIEKRLEEENELYKDTFLKEESKSLNDEKFLESLIKEIDNKEEKRKARFFASIVFLVGISIGIIIVTLIIPGFIRTEVESYDINSLGLRIDELERTVALNEDIRLSGDNSIYTVVAEKAMPSVVGITTVSLERNMFLGHVRERPGLGTGVIVDERGYILTNSHVVSDVKDLRVLLYDGEELDAEVLWNEPSLDLAIIKVDSEDLIPATLGDSDDLKVGEIAIAIGNPLGLDFERTLTQGVISGLNRSITTTGDGAEAIDDFIQTDASINPGNSGGPLLNSRGEVIGINTAKVSNSEGLGFAIPINIAKPIVNQFIETGEFQPVSLGLRGVDLEVYEKSTGEILYPDQGVYVLDVNAGGNAYLSGIRARDVIVGLNDTPIKNRGMLIRELYKLTPGDTANIELIRGEEVLNLEIQF